MCSAPNVYMFVYTLIGTHIVPLKIDIIRISVHANELQDGVNTVKLPLAGRPWDQPSGQLRKVVSLQNFK